MDMPTPTATAQTALELARSELDAIGQALASPDGVHESIHAARKAIRRLRALLQLVDGPLDLAVADRILQRTGDSLSALRDAHATIDVARGLARDEGALWEPVVARLVARRDALLAEALAHDPGFARRRAWVARAARRIDSAAWETLRGRHLRRGLERGQRRVDKARKQARREPTPDNLHRWRRRVRKLRMQVQAVHRIRPRLAAAFANDRHDRQVRRLQKLNDRLGRRQDLQVLRELITGMPDAGAHDALLVQLDQTEARIAASLAG
ncbi:CHAD domain-containing protein [Luteimonas yindakuii]|nr:CHAD domain-containing protein [Luteimonas yindakuii]